MLSYTLSICFYIFMINKISDNHSFNSFMKNTMFKLRVVDPKTKLIKVSLHIPFTDMS